MLPPAPPATVVDPNVVVPPFPPFAAPAEPNVYVTVPPGVTEMPITYLTRPPPPPPPPLVVTLPAPPPPPPPTRNAFTKKQSDGTVQLDEGTVEVRVTVCNAIS